MGDSAKKLPPLPEEGPRVDIDDKSTVVKHADMAVSSHPKARAASRSSSKKRYSLTMFPQRIENASYTSLIFILLAVFGFACGVGAMILMLQ